jgi:VanZ family protein
VRNFLKFNLRAFLWALFIIVLTILPGKVIPKVPVFLDLLQPDKLVHVFVFGVYAVLQLHGLKRQKSYPLLRKNALFITFLCGLFLAIGTELLQQYYIPMRFGSVYDFAANMAGWLLGWQVAMRFEKRAEKSG